MANGAEGTTTIMGWGGAATGIAALQGFGVGFGAIAGGLGIGALNPVTSALMPSVGDGSEASRHSVAAPSAAPKGGMGGRETQAGAIGQVQERPPGTSLFDAERGALADASDYLPNPVHDLPPEARAAMNRGYVYSSAFIVGGGAVGWLGEWALFRLGLASFGANDLVLGVSSGGALQQFVQRFGGQTFGQFASVARTFPGQIRDAMMQASRIRVNLDGIDLTLINGLLNEFGEPAAGYTNYELWLIKSTPDFLSKTSFYANGMPAPAPF